MEEGLTDPDPHPPSLPLCGWRWGCDDSGGKKGGGGGGGKVPQLGEFKPPKGVAIKITMVK